MYMMISATLFAQYPKDKRMSYVKKYYDAVSKFKINIPTPVITIVRTPLRQFASCVLVDTDDTLPSIFSSDMDPLTVMLHKEQALASTLEGFVESTLYSWWRNTTHWCHSLS